MGTGWLSLENIEEPRIPPFSHEGRRMLGVAILNVSNGTT